MVSKVYSAPSNIALIKYMGKSDSLNNLPTNSSLSYTLEHLRTFVRIEKFNEFSGNAGDQWEPLIEADLEIPTKLYPIQLSNKGKEKFIKHFCFLKELFNLKGQYKIKSANNFPSDCGIASSSSSFAALTLAAMTEFSFESGKDLDLSPSHLSYLSRQGSGSSCRSFFSPWCAWDTDRGYALDLPYKNLHHVVLLLDTGIKEVSSSEAHKRVTTSSLFTVRLSKVQNRYNTLIKAFHEQHWLTLVEVCHQEFEEMHQLFESSNPAFSYRTPKTFEVLKKLQQLHLEFRESGPIVTMDAGSNIHLLFKDTDKETALKYLSEFKEIELIKSWRD